MNALGSRGGLASWGKVSESSKNSTYTDGPGWFETVRSLGSVGEDAGRIGKNQINQSLDKNKHAQPPHHVC